MATTLRLRRVGANNVALHRIVVVDSRSPRDGRFIEIIGHYDPRKEGNDKIVVNEARLRHWLGVGARLSEALRALLRAQKIPVTGNSK